MMMKFSKVVNILIKAIRSEKTLKILKNIKYFLDTITFWMPCRYSFNVFECLVKL